MKTINSFTIERLEIIVGKLYIFLLPIRMIAPFIFLKDILVASATYFDLFLHLLGLSLILLKGISRSNGIIRIGANRDSKLFHYFVLMVVFLNTSPIFMALIMQNKYGSIGNETSFSAIAGMLIYFTQYAFIIFYNKELFKMITAEEIIIILDKVVFCLFILGCLQLAVIIIGSPFIEFHETIDIFNVLYSGSLINSMGRLTLTGSEPASAGVLIGILVLPFIMSKILVGKSVLKNSIYLLLWTIILYNTKSSSAYVITAADFAVFTVLYFRTRKRNAAALMSSIVSGILFILIVIVPNMQIITNSVVFNNINYFLVEKLTDQNNQSTVSRTIPMLVNMGAFTEYPILGVGNGNQGYFYEKYFPDWGYNSYDAVNYLHTSRQEISNGALFIPSLLSGYGIIGVIVIVIYIVKCNKMVKSKQKELSCFYYIFHISWIAVFIAGLQGEFAGEYYIWFILSIPYMAIQRSNRKQGEQW